jgi:hypothetical protein
MDADDDDNPFAGTWENTDNAGVHIIMNNNGTWEFHQSTNGNTEGDTKGTYSYKNNTSTSVATHIYMGEQWISTEGQPENIITSTAEIQNDGKLKITTFEGTFTYTKKN